jgi:hypothetical protein
MSFIISVFEKTIERSAPLVNYAKKVLMKLLIPVKISRSVVENFYRKALRTGIWRFLKPEQRALILALRIWGREVRSRKLVEIVRKIFLEIELSTFRGKALLYGIAIAIKNRLGVVKYLSTNTSYILALGIMYLNNPPMYRIYG